MISTNVRVKNFSLVIVIMLTTACVTYTERQKTLRLPLSEDAGDVTSAKQRNDLDKEIKEDIKSYCNIDKIEKKVVQSIKKKYPQATWIENGSFFYYRPVSKIQIGIYNPINQAVGYVASFSKKSCNLIDIKLTQ